MRYLILAFPFKKEIPVYTDFRLLAYLVALWRMWLYARVFILDNETGEVVFDYKRKSRFSGAIFLF